MKAFRNYLICTALFLGFLSVYLPARYQTSYPVELGPQFDSQVKKKLRNTLNEQQPEVLLLSDSMLPAALEEGTVNRLLGKKTVLASQPGIASTIWYLLLKSNIIVAEPKPQYLVLFFRDTMLTAPGYRVTGSYLELVDDYATPKDKLLIERAYINQMSLPGKIMEAYFPLYASRWSIRQSLDHSIRYSPGRVLLGCDPACIDVALEEVLAANNFNLPFFSDVLAASDEYLYTRERLNFQEQVDQSFLPEIIRLCEENEIRLILVRMPTLNFEKPESPPPGLNTYIQDLAGYLQNQGVPFFDFEQKDFSREYFVDRVHLNERGKAVFTQEFVEALLRVIE
jgi:hypothetical protein